MANFPHRPKKLEVRDEFKKDYTIQTIDDCFCVERKSMCLWEGEGATLKWNPAYNKLEVNDGTLTTLKQSFQGEIVGNSLAWGDGVSVEEGCNCDPTCCMYPANRLGDTFGAGDLPSTLYGKWGSRADGTFTKSGSTFTNGTVTIRRNTGGTAWEFYDSTDDATLTIGNCLIRGDGNLTPGDDTVEDQFADEYNIEFWSGDIIGTQFGDEYTVTRISLCLWGFSDGSISIFLAYAFSFPNGWEITVQGTNDSTNQPDEFKYFVDPETTPATATLSTPVNLYTYGMFGIPEAIVSEP
jgi:hypothetical protein